MGCIRSDYKDSRVDIWHDQYHTLDKFRLLIQLDPFNQLILIIFIIRFYYIHIYIPLNYFYPSSICFCSISLIYSILSSQYLYFITSPFLLILVSWTLETHFLILFLVHLFIKNTVWWYLLDCFYLALPVDLLLFLLIPFLFIRSTHITHFLFTLLNLFLTLILFINTIITFLLWFIRLNHSIRL